MKPHFVLKQDILLLKNILKSEFEKTIKSDTTASTPKASRII